MNVPRVIMVLLLVAGAAPLSASICINTPDAIQRVRGIVVTNEPLPLEVLSGATISLKRGKTRLEAIADSDGYFSFGQLAPGRYELRASLEGFLNASAIVVVNSRAAHNIVLLVRLTDGIERCSFVGSIAADEAAKLQEAGRRKAHAAVAAHNSRMQRTSARRQTRMNLQVQRVAGRSR